MGTLRWLAENMTFFSLERRECLLLKKKKKKERRRSSCFAITVADFLFVINIFDQHKVSTQLQRLFIIITRLYTV